MSFMRGGNTATFEPKYELKNTGEFQVKECVKKSGGANKTTSKWKW